jgi:hypothetical protein
MYKHMEPTKTCRVAYRNAAYATTDLIGPLEGEPDGSRLTTLHLRRGGGITDVVNSLGKKREIPPQIRQDVHNHLEVFTAGGRKILSRRPTGTKAPASSTLTFYFYNKCDWFFLYPRYPSTKTHPRFTQ